MVYRYVPQDGDVHSGLYPYRRLDDVEILRPFKGTGGHEGYNIAYFADALDLAGGESLSHGLSLDSSGIGYAATLLGKSGILAILMPVRLADESVEVEVSTPAGPVEVIGAKVPDTGATNKNPSRAAIGRWLQKDLEWFRKSEILLGVGTVKSQGRYERWIATDRGAIRLPASVPNQPLTGITYENLEGWMKVNWPSEAPIPALGWRDIGHQALEQLAAITNGDYPAKLVKGLDAVRGLGAFVDPERYGLEHVVLSNGTLEATDGHKGIQVTELPYSEDDLEGRRNIGLNPGLFQGLPVYVSSSAWATSGHLLALATENVEIPNLSGIINTDEAFKQTFELTGPLIQQILKKSTAKKGKGEPLLILSPDGFHIDYAEHYYVTVINEHGEKRKKGKYRLHASIPFLKSLKPQNQKGISGVNFKYFKETIFAMSAKPGPITINLRGELDPWTFTKWGSPDIAAVLMPLRGVGEYDEDEEE